MVFGGMGGVFEQHFFVKQFLGPYVVLWFSRRFIPPTLITYVVGLDFLLGSILFLLSLGNVVF